MPRPLLWLAKRVCHIEAGKLAVLWDVSGWGLLKWPVLLSLKLPGSIETGIFRIDLASSPFTSQNGYMIACMQ